MFCFRPSVRGFGHANELLVREFVDAVVRQLAPHTGGLHATEREIRCGFAGAVDPHHAGLDQPGYTLRTLEIT